MTTMDSTIDMSSSDPTAEIIKKVQQEAAVANARELIQVRRHIEN